MHSYGQSFLDSGRERGSFWLLSDEKKDSSFASFLSSLLINSIIFLILLTLFFILRVTFVRIYSPRTYVGSVPKDKQPKRLPTSPFRFLTELIKLDDRYTIGKTSLDGFLFLRFLKIVVYITAVGTIVTLLVLLPINAYGSENGAGLDKFSISNIGNNQKTWLYAHAIIAWLFFSFVLLVVYQELRFFIALRNAYVISKAYTSRISARTVLITCIPDAQANETSLREVFDNVETIWINTDVKELGDAVEERTKSVADLEIAELTYIQAVDKRRKKMLKDGNGGDVEQPLVGSEWASRKDRPTQRTIPLIGRKVDAIDFNRQKLANLNKKIKDLQEQQESGDAKAINSAFIEFKSQRAAQSAFQCVAYSTPLQMAPRYIAIHPEEIIWSNMRLVWWSRLLRIAGASTFVAAMIVFWAIPVGLVGSLSNIDELTEKFQFLSFINDLPESILGSIKGFLPSALLAALMALVPIILRVMAKFAGAPSLSHVELHTQIGYFVFQVVQVFLVETLSTSATAVFSKISKDPTSATSVLARKLPKSSNFYIAYVVLQGLSLSASQLLQIAVVLTVKLISPILDTTPRKRWDRWINLASLGWGTIFPVYTNLAVITLAYAMIAPLILPFAAIGIGIFYLAYKHNFIYVYNITIDTKGMVYPLALQQMLTGVYLGELCLLGLFGINKAKGPSILMVLLFLGTIIYHITLRATMGELLEYIPMNILKQNEEDGITTDDYQDRNGDHREEHSKAQRFLGFLNPTPGDVSELANTILPDIVTERQSLNKAYVHPSVAVPVPKIWIPRDEAEVSKQEIEDSKEYDVEVSDDNAWIDEKGKLKWEPLVGDEQVNPPDFKQLYLL